MVRRVISFSSIFKIARYCYLFCTLYSTSSRNYQNLLFFSRMMSSLSLSYVVLLLLFLRESPVGVHNKLRVYIRRRTSHESTDADPTILGPIFFLLFFLFFHFFSVFVLTAIVALAVLKSWSTACPRGRPSSYSFSILSTGFDEPSSFR